MKTSKYIFIILIGAAFLWTAGQLFFERETKSLLRPSAEKPEDAAEEKTLRIAVPYDFQKEHSMLEPTDAEWPIFTNVFEPLVRQDGNLRIRPALALSWGKKTDESEDLDQYGDDIWEFRLRPGVTFHDGSRFDAQDVVATYERARTAYRGSTMDNILRSIESLEATDDLTVRIRTNLGDPILLERLSLLLILPSESAQKQDIPFVGTGPYRVQDWSQEKITLEQFPSYWGEKNNITAVHINYIDALNMNQAVEEEEADIFFGYHHLTSSTNIKPPYRLTKTPGLRTFYLAFNFMLPFFETTYDYDQNGKIMVDTRRKKAFSLAIDQQAIMDALGIPGRTISQFVPPGVFGFDPDIPPHEYDLEKAKKLAEESGMTKETLRFAAFEKFEKFTEYLSKQMEAIGVPYEHIRISSKDETAELGDFFLMTNENFIPNSTYFLESSVKSKAQGNLGGYEEIWADSLINLAQADTGISSRQEDIFDAMKYIVEEIPLGVPLFAEDNMVVHRDSLRVPFRFDGLLYFNNLTMP